LVPLDSQNPLHAIHLALGSAHRPHRPMSPHIALLFVHPGLLSPCPPQFQVSARLHLLNIVVLVLVLELACSLLLYSLPSLHCSQMLCVLTLHLNQRSSGESELSLREATHFQELRACNVAILPYYLYESTPRNPH